MVTLMAAGSKGAPVSTAAVGRKGEICSKGPTTSRKGKNKMPLLGLLLRRLLQAAVVKAKACL